jgi:hypothetical protein
MTALLKNNYKQQIPFALTALLLISLIVSRAALSLFSALLIMNYFFLKENRAIIKNCIISLVFIIIPVIISGMWSFDKQLWWNTVLIKLPLISISVGLLAANLSANQIKQLIWLLTVLVFVGCAWSIFEFLINHQFIIKSYLVAKVMATPLDEDHIRYSWLVVLTIIVLLWQMDIQSTRKEKIIGASIILFLIIYLHLLAAKTGLLCLYVAILFYVINFIFNKRNFKKGFIILLLLFVISFTSYQLFPTLHNRIQYTLWDYQQYSNGQFIAGSDDGNRINSLIAGLNIVQSKPFTGEGFGDLTKSINNWYSIHLPYSASYERIIPLNEWMIYAAASGWIGMCLFSIGLFILFLKVFSKNIFSIIIGIVLLIPFLFDDVIEGQFGVTIFSVMIIFQYYLNRISKSLPV